MAAKKIQGLTAKTGKKTEKTEKTGKKDKTFFFEETEEYKLKKAIFEAVCDVCGCNRPSVTRTSGRVRYIQCRRCHKTGKIVI